MEDTKRYTMKKLNKIQLRKLVRNILAEQTGMPSNYDPVFQELRSLCKDLGQNCDNIENKGLQGKMDLIGLIRKATGK
tara:strand:+ start:187 stop:420 length:234 start_codon:yes stop_codon:yes gene_type:complete